MTQPNLFDQPENTGSNETPSHDAGSSEPDSSTLENTSNTTAANETPSRSLEVASNNAVPDGADSNEPISQASENPTPENTVERGVPPTSETLELPARTTKSNGTLPRRVILIDGHALAYRSYFALQRGSGTLKTSDGKPTQAIFGFMKTLMKLLRDGADARNKKPDALRLTGDRDHAVIVVFDPPVKTFRHEAFEHYKAGRAETPDDLPAQIHAIKKLVDLMGLVRLEVPGFEADDVIGTVAKRAEDAGCEVRILTSDRDAYQLLSDRVKVIGSDYAEIGPPEVLAKYGVSVEQWVDYRALTGDSSDNIPGAKGIGPKSAQKLLEAYGSLQYILDHLDEVKPDKDATKIRESFENVLFSKELSRIVTSVDVGVDLASAKVHEPNVPELTQLLRDLEFSSFIKEMGLESVRSINRAQWLAPDAGAVWGFVLSEDSPVSAEMTALAYADPRAASADGHWVVREPPTPSLEALGQNTVLHGADAKLLVVHALSRGQQAVPGDDPILMAYCIDPGNAEPDRVAQRYLESTWPKDAAGRADASARLLGELPHLMAPEIRMLYNDLEKPVSVVLAKMEARGILIDASFLRALSSGMGARIQALEHEVWALSGEEFNLNSRDKLETILYDKLQLESGKKTKTTGKRSTAVSELEKLRDVHPIVPKILEYREMAKLRGTYLDPLPAMVSPRTGRLHTTFSQTVAATGRLSSINPNLQNIPVRTEAGREIRKGFIAAPGYSLLSADYSQIELRILAHITAEPGLIEGFQRDEDIHRRTAATILGVPVEAVTSDQRRAAKVINYGVLYGMSAHRLANETGLEFDQAKGFIERYFGTYPGINQYLEDTKAFCREHGYVQDLFGRRRYIPEINHKAFAVREAAERAAINMPIQGTSAGIIKRAMIDLDPHLESHGAYLLLQVHDELVVECPQDRVEVVSRLMCEKMEGAFPLKVPLGVDVGAGQSWYDAK
jgi:DNA polymerase-1